MTDELDRLLQATRGQSPSPEFRARLRAQIVAETEGRASIDAPIDGDTSLERDHADESGWISKPICEALKSRGVADDQRLIDPVL